MLIPETVKINISDLENLCKNHPATIPVTAVAEFLHCDKDGLRTMLERGNCPFGIGWRKPGKEKSGCVIPTAQFYMWYTNTRVTDINT